MIDHFWAQNYDGDIVSPQDKTKCPVSKSLSKLSVQDVRSWGQAVLDRPSKANLEKKEYSIERTGFWKNQVTFITSKLEALNNGNREKGLLTSTQYFREVQDGIY